MSTLPLNDVVQVKVEVSPASATRAGFNVGLIIGKATVIPAETRLKEYAGLEDMIADGFTSAMPEYQAAAFYFMQKKRPNRVMIGVCGEEEDYLDAVTACRTKNSDWYAVACCGASKADVLAIAAYIETAVPSSVFFYTTADAADKSGSADGAFKTLQSLSYLRSIGQYSTTADAVCSIMGYAMGANTGLASSAYTLAYKQEPGVEPEDLSLTDVSAIKGVNGNVYINRGNTYNLFEQGVMADGTPFDEVINLDVLANDIQLSVMDLLAGYAKVPQTEGGVALIISSITAPCRQAVSTGFIAPGVWNGPSILTLNTGDTLSDGFLVLSESVAGQSTADRAARKAPPIYVPIKLAGAIESVIISVVVDR
ncbi:hypothetical protein HMPREF0322_00401 [Desulfitobacterium hafniense DP7]|uniref:Uncharacterized protein n=1 Tax=Desulfitobacterium hafniense DP7 TaxID=537010 RepID=G9XHH6_DESHA|nr:DUF3383 family protein [Desulfitobacterium hafniense]EHL08978.1 hypothetical protein HMPREF0322_00401 [Desulfitobacterium hafniense DP7]